ncbi:MAG: geranylgeranyl reductase family protein [Dehalococcoidia bacterium]|nr:geranylgeranyl reductase family protein [Dehalococcoidia bacterium]
MTYDVIVAGAGPAGSTAARLLAGRGASVLLLERHAFPRDKPCGGGVTLRAAAAQDLDLSPVVERTIYGVRFSLRLGPGFQRRFRAPLSYMTQRCRLDAFLAERAAEAGAAFHDGEAVREVDVHPNGGSGFSNGGSGFSLTPVGVAVRTDRDTYTASILIGADGANGLVGRAAGLRPDFEEAVALEANVPFAHDIPDAWKEYVALDVGGLAGGYGWVFPKGQHLNVGVGAWKYAAFTLRPKLARLCRRYGFDPARLEDLRGHHLPVRVPGTPIASGPVALVGDAAGLVDPLSGEGIHMAFASGRLAAASALAVLSGAAPDMLAYQRAVDRRLQPELTVSRKLQELFNFAPPPYVAVMRRSEKFWLFFCHLIRGELTYLDFVRLIGPLRLAVDFFAAAAQRRRLAKVAALAPLIRGG